MNIDIDRTLFYRAIANKKFNDNLTLDIIVPTCDQLKETMAGCPDIFYNQLFQYYTSLNLAGQFQLHYKVYHFLQRLAQNDWYECNEMYAMVLLYYLWQSQNLALGRYVNPLQLVNNDLFYVYHPSWEKIFLTSLYDERQHLFTGVKENEQPVLCFWKRHPKNAYVLSKEFALVQKLTRAGMLCYDFDTSYYFWGEPVIVTENMRFLVTQDNPYLIAADILDQLYFVHQFGVSNQIKPHNIMCREEKEKPIKRRYFLFRFHHMATEKLGRGFYRRHWSRMFSSQISCEQPQMTLPYHDLLELAYVVNYLLAPEDNNCRRTQDYKVSHYLQHLYTLSLKPTLQDYQDLKLILLS